MSIRLKILLACLSLTAVTVMSGLIARTSQAQLAGFTVRLYDEAFMSMSYLRSAQNTILSLSKDLGPASPDRRAETDDRLEAALSDLQVAFERSLSPRGAAAASVLKDRIQALRRHVLVDASLDRGELADIQDHLDTAVEINAGDGFRYRRKAGELVKHAEAQSWTIMGLSVAFALVVTMLLSRAIVPSVRHAVGIATKIAAGRLDNPIPTGASGETAVLLRALSTMQRSIAEKIATIEQLMARQASSHATEIAHQHHRFEAALDNMVQGLCMLDGERQLLVHNRRFGEMFVPVPAGVQLSSALPAALIAPDHAGDDGGSREFTRQLEDQRTIAVSERPMDSGGWVITFEDVSERHRSEARLAYLARHDGLTGLSNRLHFCEQLDLELADARQPGGIAVFCVNLDGFKSVNDALGHSVGDAVLCQVAQRLLEVVAPSDTVVRLGGDEFGIIQCAQSQPNDAKRLAERVGSALVLPIEAAAGQAVSVSASIGIAIHGAGSSDRDTLMRSAGLALYRAKFDERGTFCFFEAAMDASMQARRRLEIDLRQAIENGDFVVYYQPLVTAATRVVSGFEALVRWQHPTRGMVSPAEFIPVAEETGLIGRLGAFVLEQACRDAAHWPDGIKVAVNLSALQFRDRKLTKMVAAALEGSGLPAARLELEVTESVMLQDGDAITVMLHEMRSLGARISMDDFGTGYSSLSYLRRFPFDKIKIDQSFVRNLDDNNDCLAIIRAVLGLGRSLGMQVVAEGVETEEQYALLHREGCEQLQGYLFSRPRPANEIAPLIARNRRLEAA